jgi:hypothetical protein
MLITDGGAAVCATIVGAPEAWMKWADLEALHGAEALAEALVLEVIEKWERPDYLAVTLTPIGAWLLGTSIDEVWRKGVEERTERDEDRPLSPPKLIREKVMLEVPRWVRPGVHRSKHVTIPRCMRIGISLEDIREPAAPERKVEPADEFVTGEDGQPLELFGVKVRRKRRRKAKRAG